MIDEYAVEIDSECLYQDFDDVDLHCERLVKDNIDSINENVEFE